MPPRGRPPSIGQTHRVEADGTRVTIGDAIVRNLGAGMYVETAARAAGVSKEALYSWLKRGARARQAALRLGQPIAATERLYVLFADAVDKATAEAEARDVALLAQLGRGNLPQRVITRKVEIVRDPETGEETERELERTVRELRTLPDARVLMWRLERRFSARWGQRGSLEVTGPGGAPLIPAEDRARDLAESLRDFLAGVETAAETPSPNGSRGAGEEG